MRRVGVGFVVLLVGLVTLGLGTSTAAASSTSCANPSSGPAAIRIALGQTRTVQVPADDSAVATQYVCPIGSSSGTDVLDIRAARSGSSDFFLCLSGIPDTSDLSSTTYGRTSNAAGSKVQRTAIAEPGDPEYEVDEIALAPGVGTLASASGCGGSSIASSLLGAPQAYSLTISYTTVAARAASHGFAFSTRHLPIANPSQSPPGSGEPTIVVDRLHGNRVYVSGPVGVPSGLGCALSTLVEFQPESEGCNGVNFWFSTNGGSSFKFCNASLPNGGGDSHVAVDRTGSIYSADLAASNVDVQKLSSTASGPSTPTAGANCGFANAVPAAPDADRQWLAVFDPTKDTSAAKVFLGYHTLAPDDLPYECSSLDGGMVWISPCSPMITPAAGLAFTDAFGNTINGNQVIDSQGRIFSIFGTSTAPDNATAGGTGAIHNLYVAASSDGVDFTVHPIFLSTPPGTSGTQSLEQIFPVIAVDRADNLYAVWSQGKAGAAGGTKVFLSSSIDHGQHWSRPVQVNGTGLGSNVLPWVVAGSDGRVDVVWVGSKDANANDPRADWFVYMAQSTNAHTAAPTFQQTVVSPYAVRRGDVCFAGLNCTFNGDDGRILLDFISVDIDSRCMARIAYGDAGPDTEKVGDGFDPYTDYAAQTAGSSLCK